MTDRITLTRRFNLGVATLAFGAAALLGATAHAATITETWDGDETGNADSWPSQWTQRDSTATVQITGNVGEVTTPTATGYVRNYINTMTAENIDQQVTLAIGGGNSQLMGGLIARLHDDSDTFYVVSVGRRTNLNESLGIYKFVDGTRTQLTENNMTLDRGAQYNLRFLVETNEDGNTDLRVKLWSIDDPEPDDWTLQALNDSTAELKGASGRFGTWSHFTSSSHPDGHYTRFDNYIAIPEPATLALGLVGGGLMLLPRRRQCV